MYLPVFLVFLLLAAVKSEYKYETKWFTVPLDHFSFHRKETFKMKYLVNEDHWDKKNGPIFFYTGNEGQIELFAKHTGFMWDIAEEFSAKIVFAEHRYYGESMPFVNKTISLDNEHVGFLTSEQALADYADLIDFLQSPLPASLKPKHPVIAFGGSYGGMLAAYFRIKYPHLVTGAIAASAPIHMYSRMVPCEVYNRIVTSSFRNANFPSNHNCADNIRNSWAAIRNVTSNPNNTLHKDWKLCDPVKNSTDVSSLMDFLNNMYSVLAMVNYPFPSDFLVPLPGQPVRYVCQYLNETLTGKKLIDGIGKVLQVYTNYDGKGGCVDYRKGADYGNLDASGWNFQACTEMVMPMCTNGKDDMFEPKEWNMTEFAEDCHKQFGVYPRPEAARIHYGGSMLQAASNIVFSNGLLDPWAGGGILNGINESVVSVVIINGAHHLDLMPANEKDPETVIAARNTHKDHIRRWIRAYRESS